MALRFVKVEGPQPAAGYLSDTLARHLAKGERVLWLLSGGSAVPIAVEVARRLRELSGARHGLNLAGLVVSLIDERYGEPGHAESNWQALTESGLSLPGATLLPVLVAGASLTDTAARFGRTLEARLAAADYSLGLLGIGPDGHIAGILPRSPAVTAPGLTAAYDGRALPPVTPGGPQYQRVTMTPAALRQLDGAVLYVVGKSKWPILDALAGPNNHQGLSEQPAQVLKQLHQVTVFNDHIGDSST
jgi:6-phosphogluconolactonase/glucosamine-6-phosphate isomerase/deaminase